MNNVKKKCIDMVREIFFFSVCEWYLEAVFMLQRYCIVFDYSLQNF